MPTSLAPDQALQKVLKISRLNGWSVAIFAGLCTLITILIGDVTGIAVGTLVVISGLMEVRGNQMLTRRNPEGLQWLIRAQLLLLSVIVIYAATRLITFRSEMVMQSLSADMRDTLKHFDLSAEEIVPLIRKVVWAFYSAVILATCIYQGGLALYYRRRKPLIAQALAAPPVVSSS